MKFNLNYIFTKVGLALTCVVLGVFIILKLCCLIKSEFELVFLFISLAYFILICIYLDKLKKYMEIIKLISYIFIITLVYFVFFTLRKTSVLIWLYTTILSSYFIMQQKYANVIAFITFFVMLVGYYLGYMDRYDFLNFGSALIVFSVFSFYIFKLVEKYQKMRDEKEEMLKSMAQIDTLTGIYNRRKFFELAKEINNPSALILMDLDKFKLINDTYGHHIGDLVLKEFANTVSNSIRKNDIFARIGGEEFALILPNITEYEAIKVAENLRKKIEDLNINGLKFTISMGVTTFHDEEITEALKRADKALYKAKKVRNRVEYI